MASHQKERIEAFLHPDDPTYKGNYQVIQSMIAIGSGNLISKHTHNTDHYKSSIKIFSFSCKYYHSNQE